MKERVGDEPLWQTFDRIMDEFLSLRAARDAASARAGREAAPVSPRPARGGREGGRDSPLLPGLLDHVGVAG